MGLERGANGALMRFAGHLCSRTARANGVLNDAPEGAYGAAVRDPDTVWRLAHIAARKGRGGSAQPRVRRPRLG